MKSRRFTLKLCLVSAFTLVLGLVWTTFGTATATAANAVTFPDLYEASITELQEGLEKGHFTSVDLVKVHHYLRR